MQPDIRQSYLLGSFLLWKMNLEVNENIVYLFFCERFLFLNRIKITSIFFVHLYYGK